MAPKARLFALTLLLSLGLDQASKQWIIAHFRYGERLPLVSGVLDLTHVRNPGGAFSFFADGPLEQRLAFFIGTTCVAIVLLLVFYRRLEPNARLASVSLGIILGGAIGNLIDRVIYAEVIDFLDVHLWGGYTWPTFNLADSWIVVGVMLLILETFSSPPEGGAGIRATDPDPDQPITP